MNGLLCNAAINSNSIQCTEWWTRVPQSSLQKRRITTQPTNLMVRRALTDCRTWKSERKNGWSPLVVGPFALDRASNSITVVSTPSKPFGRLAKMLFSSTTTLKLFRPTLIPRTVCTLTPLLWNMLVKSYLGSRPMESCFNLEVRPPSTSPCRLRLVYRIWL